MIKEIINEIKDKKSNGQKTDSDIDKIKKLEKEAEKYIAMAKSKMFKTIVSKKFSLSYNKDFYIKSFKPEYNFKFDGKDMENFLTSYKYYNIKNKKTEYFKAFDLLKHLRYGLIYKYDLNAKKGWYNPPTDQITFKISENEKNIEVSCQKTKNKTYINYLYSWANGLVVIDTLNQKLISSLTGWLQIFRRILEGLDGFTQAETFKVLREAFASYFLNKPNALVISHVKNYQKLSDRDKRLVYFIVTEDRYLTANFAYRKHFYVGEQLKNSYQDNFISKCAKPNGQISNRNISIYDTTDIGTIPYIRLYRYTLTNTFPTDNIWFNDLYDFNFPKIIKLTNENYDYLDKQNDIVITLYEFTKSEFSYSLTTTNLNTIKKFNNFDDELKDINIEVAKTSYEHSYFLYDNNSLIRENFVSELNKRVYLIGSISFYEEINETGKSFLIRNETKLKFDVKKNQVIENFNFNLSHTNASGKILLKTDEIQNPMIIGTEKLTRNGQKRKMVEVIDTIIVKALQSYDKYSTLNPLEINLNSNYLSKIIHDYKGFTFEVRLINVLFSSSLENDTQNIFIVCHNLNSAKKALINNKIYSLLEIINLNEIKQWSEMKGKSLYVNAKIDDSHYMQNAKHFGFKFKSSFPTEFLEFTCEFLDDKADQIKFADGENKVPIIDLQIDILK